MSLALPYFFVFTLFGVMTPYLPVLIRNLGYSTLVVGLLMGLVEVAGIAGPFLFGRFADRMGRYRPALLLALCLVLLSIAPLILFHHPLVSALSLIVLAVGLRSTLPLMDAVATLNLGATGNYGRVRSVGSASFVLMALFLQYTPLWHPSTNIHIAVWAVITGVLTLLSFFALRDQNPAELKAQRPAPAPSGPHSRSWDSVFILGLVLLALGRLAISPINAFISLYALEELHWDAVGIMWALSAGAEIPFMFISAGLIRRYGSPRLLSIATAALAVRLGIYALFPTIPGAVVGQLLHSLCYGLFHPAAVAFVATRVAPEKRALGMTMYLSLSVGLPGFIGSSIGGVIVQYLGYRLLFACFIPFALASSILIFLWRKTLEAPARY